MLSASSSGQSLRWSKRPARSARRAEVLGASLAVAAVDRVAWPSAIAAIESAWGYAFLVRVLVERKQPGFVLLNELHQPRHPLALVLELPFLEPVYGNEDERS